MRLRCADATRTLPPWVVAIHEAVSAKAEASSTRTPLFPDAKRESRQAARQDSIYLRFHASIQQRL